MTNDLAEFATDTDVFLLIGTNTSECHPIIAMQIVRGLERGAKLIVIDIKKTDMAKKADIFLQIPVGYNIRLINSMINYIIQNDLYDKDFVENYTDGFEWLKETVKDFTFDKVEKDTGISKELLIKATEMYAKGNPSALLYTMGITQFTDGTYNVMSTSNLAILTGNLGKKGGGVNPLRGQNNVQGAGDMGALPGDLPSGKVTDVESRKKAEEIWGFKINSIPGLKLSHVPHAIDEGKVKFLYIFGENPVMSDPWTEHFVHALKKTDFIVVQDIFFTETAQRADVVLPSACWGEKDGTFLNTSRKVQLVRKAVEPHAGLEPDWKVICNVANKMGLKGFSFNTAEEIWNEVRKLNPFKFKGITYERMAKLNGINWPCPDESHPGTPYLYEDNKSFLANKKFKLAPIGYTLDKNERFVLENKIRKELNIPEDYPLGVGCPSEEPTEEYPCMYTTGRKVYHYHTGTMTRKCKSLEMGADIMGPVIEVSEDIARERNLENGCYAVLWNKRGKIAAKLMINKDLRHGTIFTTFHYAEADGNELTSPEDEDPISGMTPLKMSIANIKKISEEEYLKIRKETLSEIEPEIIERRG
jgi:formate dehydrogenase major subunit